MKGMLGTVVAVTAGVVLVPVVSVIGLPFAVIETTRRIRGTHDGWKNPSRISLSKGLAGTIEDQPQRR